MRYHLGHNIGREKTLKSLVSFRKISDAYGASTSYGL
jgi:hypothetical protein